MAEDLRNVLKLEDFKSKDELAEYLKARDLVLSAQEVLKIKDLLGRNPSLVELYIFNGEWSEHCSYKSSRAFLKKYFHTDGPTVAQGPQEDAGILFIEEINGVKWCLVIGHESHNHPSQVLPVEGAATGIGGIVRDVDCMGADVIGVLDPLRFGDPKGKHSARTKWIAGGVVEGIMEYGNALGVPNLGGDVYFNESFDDNCLVNVVAIGRVAYDDIIHSKAPPAAADMPYDVILVGKPTDASGFGGAAFASEDMDTDKDIEKQGAVQVHDPFLKNVLAMRKANRAVLDKAKELGYAVGFKDLGGAGLACASSEMAAAGNLGVRIYLDRVHVAIENLPPEVIACAETQERYLLMVPREFSKQVLHIYNHDWELPKISQGACARIIGEVIDEPDYILLHDGEPVVAVPVCKLVGAISEDHPREKPQIKLNEPVFPMPEDLGSVLLRILEMPEIACKAYIYNYYDTEVQGNAVIRSGEADAGVIAPLLEYGGRCGIAIATDNNPFYGRIDPYWGGANAVFEAMRNVAAVGAKPIGLTDCLNFGNPTHPVSYWQFEEGIRGVAEAAKGIRLKDYPGQPCPIVSGNVSLYNRSASGVGIDPSPIICAVGLLDDFSKAITMQLKASNDLLLLIGARRDECGGSAFYRSHLDSLGANVPRFDFEEATRMIHAVIDIIDQSLARACHDISDGGLAVCLAEMCMGARANGSVGISVDLSRLGSHLRADKLLFSESGGFVLEIPPENYEICNRILLNYGIYYRYIGETRPEQRFTILERDKALIDLEIRQLIMPWTSGLEKAMR